MKKKKENKEDRIIWFFSEKERDKKIKELKKEIGIDKFGNLLNGQCCIDHYENKKGFVLFGITKS